MTLAALYRCLTLDTDPQIVAQQLAEAIAQYFAVDVVYFEWDCLIDHIFAGSWSRDPNFLGFTTLSRPEQVLVLSGAALDQTPYQAFQAAELTELVLIPFVLTDHRTGWLGMSAKGTVPDPETLTTTLVPLLNLAAQQFFLQHQNSQHQRRNTLLTEVRHVIDSERTTHGLLQKAIALIVDCYDVEFGCAGLFKYANPLLSRNTSQSCPSATLNVITETTVVPQQIMLQDCYLCAQAWQFAPEVLAINQRADGHKLTAIAPQYQSILIAPLMGRQSMGGQARAVLGLILLVQKQTRIWQPQEKQLAQFLAKQLSTAILHQQSLQRVQSLVDERTAQLKWSLDVQAKLGSKMRQQIQQLRQLNVLKDEFLSTMSHELNTPLATMRVAVKMLKQPGRSPEKQATYLDILEQELKRESKLVEDLLKLQHFESERFAIKPQRLVLNKILAGLQEEFNQRWQLLKGLQLEVVYFPATVTQKLQIETDEESLTNAISELLTNAGKYSTRNTTVRLEVEYLARSPATIRIRLSNDGARISEEEQAVIFEKFRRGSGVTDQAIPGTGLGLALVKALVEQLEGTIDVSSTPNDDGLTSQTCFEMTFPQSMTGL